MGGWKSLQCWGRRIGAFQAASPTESDLITRFASVSRLVLYVARSGGNNRIVPLYGLSGRLWVLSTFAGGTDHADLFIPVRSLPEDLLAPDDHSRSRQKAGQMPKMRQSEGSPAVEVVRGQDIEEKLIRGATDRRRKPKLAPHLTGRRTNPCLSAPELRSGTPEAWQSCRPTFQSHGRTCWRTPTLPGSHTSG